jgi:hypothetical protein
MICKADHPEAVFSLTPGFSQVYRRMNSVKNGFNRFQIFGLSTAAPNLRALSLRVLLVPALLALCLCVAHAQPRPYIGFAYPAGGKQGTTVEVKLGGQALDDLSKVVITGEGVSGRVVDYQKALSNQEYTLLAEQVRLLKRNSKESAGDMMSAAMMTSGAEMSAEAGQAAGDKGATNPNTLLSKAESRMAGFVNRPASAALAHIALIEITVDSDAKPGARELRLMTAKGLSNPLPFYVGQVPEYVRKPMLTAAFQVLGKEQLAMRKRPPEEFEQAVELPCTVNGQVASGEVNRYRFKAEKGQKLVISTLARQLVPFIADAVPGWFQPVVRILDSNGKEIAYQDDFRFRPDPVILFDVPETGEYLLDVYDAIFRGREDFVYRITMGEIPFITSVYPLGAQSGGTPEIKVEGWNLDAAATPKIEQREDGSWSVSCESKGLTSNPVPIERDEWPEYYEQEANDTPSKAQLVKLPAILNGRMDRKGDWDVFKVAGKSNQVLVAEVRARRLESPLDSVLKVTDKAGRLLAFNDDKEDRFAGANTHDADSYVMATFPSNGTYFVHIGDAARDSGPEYAYRLRLSRPQPDFALRIVPSSLALRAKGSGTVQVHLDRKDGFEGPVKLSLKQPSKRFLANSVSLTGTQTVARLSNRTDLKTTDEPVNVEIIGTAKINGVETVRQAVPAEDRMQAFLWRHLVPASAFQVHVYDPSQPVAPKRVAPELSAETLAKIAAASSADAKPKFTKQQVAGRLRQLKFLYENGLLTDDFYLSKVAECEAVKQE